MDDPKHTAEWLLDQVYELTKSDPSHDIHTIGTLVVVLNRFDHAMGDLYFRTATSSEKISGARTALLRVIGAEPAGGHTRDGLLSHASIDLTVLARQEFRLLD